MLFSQTLALTRRRSNADRRLDLTKPTDPAIQGHARPLSLPTWRPSLTYDVNRLAPVGTTGGERTHRRDRPAVEPDRRSRRRIWLCRLRRGDLDSDRPTGRPARLLVQIAGCLRYLDPCEPVRNQGPHQSEPSRHGDDRRRDLNRLDVAPRQLTYTVRWC